MLGFTIPLLIGLALEGLMGALLLGPPATAKLAACVSRLSYRKEGSIVTYTVASMLALMLVSPLYEAYRMRSATVEEEKASHDRTEQELSTLLSAVLLLTNLGGLFFVRKLGAVVSACESQRMSEKALLRQVQGLQQEYSRMVDSGGAQGGTVGAEGGSEGAEGADSAAVQQQRQLEAWREEKEALEARLAAAERAQRSAEANLSALKTQSRGLENEYDRLMAEHEELQRKLQRAGLEPGAGAQAGSFDKKEA